MSSLKRETAVGETLTCWPRRVKLPRVLRLQGNEFGRQPRERGRIPSPDDTVITACEAQPRCAPTPDPQRLWGGECVRFWAIKFMWIYYAAMQNKYTWLAMDSGPPGHQASGLVPTSSRWPYFNPICILPYSYSLNITYKPTSKLLFCYHFLILKYILKYTKIYFLIWLLLWLLPKSFLKI